MATHTNKELFLGPFIKVLKEQQQPDVRLKACDSDEDASIPVHKLLLSARSEVFKYMLESDNLKASVRQVETVTLSDLKHEELEAFVEFIYSEGSMLSEKANQHVRSLYIAADKYEIPHRRDLCRTELISSLNSSNVLDVLAIAQIPFDKSLNDAALTVIKICKSTICSSVEFKVFVVNHPNLTIEIMKAISEGGYCPHCRRH